jgi:hypothetical protein
MVAVVDEREVLRDLLNDHADLYRILFPFRDPREREVVRAAHEVLKAHERDERIEREVVASDADLVAQAWGRPTPGLQSDAWIAAQAKGE